MLFNGIFKLLNRIEVKSVDLPTLFQCQHPIGQERPVGPLQSQMAKLDAPPWQGCSDLPGHKLRCFSLRSNDHEISEDARCVHVCQTFLHVLAAVFLQLLAHTQLPSR